MSVESSPALTEIAPYKNSPPIHNQRRAPILNPPLLCSPVSPLPHAKGSGEIEITQILIPVHHDAIQEFVEALDVGD